MGNCEYPARSCQHLNFCFSGKIEHFYWLRTKELCWEASTFSLFFSAAPWLFSTALKLLLGFSQQLQKRTKIQMFSTPCLSVTSLGLSLLKSLRLYQNWSNICPKNLLCFIWRKWSIKLMWSSSSNFRLMRDQKIWFRARLAALISW